MIYYRASFINTLKYIIEKKNLLFNIKTKNIEIHLMRRKIKNENIKTSSMHYCY